MIDEINVRDVEKYIEQGAIVLDVRTKDEYNNGHISGSINIDIHSNVFKENVDKLDKERSYVVCCASGGRSAKATQVMLGMGFGDVHNMIGGMIDWEKEGLPTTK